MRYLVKFIFFLSLTIAFANANNQRAPSFGNMGNFARQDFSSNTFQPNFDRKWEIL
jgi:hypothetical protein